MHADSASCLCYESSTYAPTIYDNYWASCEMSSADEIRDHSQSLARSRTNGGIVQVVLRKAVVSEILSGCFEMGCFLLECNTLPTEAPT